MEALDELQLSAPLLQLISLQTATTQPVQCLSPAAVGWKVKGIQMCMSYHSVSCLPLTQMYHLASVFGTQAALNEA